MESGSKWGFVMRNGQWAIRPKYDGAYSFSDELAIVKMGKATGYIDKTGRSMKHL